ncbi:YedE family putative selenium transporter [Chloroflexota bacterium]
MRRFFAPKALIILAGLVMGILAALLIKWGNPPNMGVCVACFMRDIAGALGLHRAGIVQYIRPEIPGLVVGSFIAAFAFGEFRARGGSSPLVRFLLGALVMIGSLVFLGCPIRAILRLAGGDLNGITGLAGVAVAALAGIFFLRRGYNLGRAVRIPATAGWIVPLAMIGLLFFVFFRPGFIFFSEQGPGSQYAAFSISLGAGLLIGFLAQRTRMCFVGAWRDIFLIKDGYLMSAVVACFIGALILNLILGQFHLGFDGQPIAHSNHLWNFAGMVLVGLAATLLGGCPLRQLILSGEGDTDAGVTILGLFAGAAFAHNFGLASSGAGPSVLGPLAVILSLVITICLGLLMRVRLS